MADAESGAGETWVNPSEVIPRDAYRVERAIRALRAALLPVT